MGRIRIALIILMLVTSVSSVTAAPATQRITAVFFSETQNWIAPPFYQFWSTNGELPIFGYPLAPTDLMTSPDDGQVYATQIFERARLEYHPENPEPYRVQLGRLGAEVLQQQGRNWQDFPKGTPKRGCDFFPETGHTLCEPFRSYWRRYGLELGFLGVTYAESLALFGLPLSEPTMETNAEGATVLTQWFERARFEYHPNNPPQYQVLLGLLGKERYGPYRPGVASVRGQASIFLQDGEVHIEKASVGIIGPKYPEGHPLYDVVREWFATLADIQADNTFTFPAFIPALPGASMILAPGPIDGSCPNGQQANFFPFGAARELSLEPGQTLDVGEYRLNVICGGW